MGDVKREQEKRTTRILDKSKIGVAPNCAGGLVGSKQIVSRKHILANKSLQSSGRSNDLNKYSHSHGHGSRVGIKPNPASAVQSANHHSVSSASQNVSAVSMPHVTQNRGIWRCSRSLKLPDRKWVIWSLFKCVGPHMTQIQGIWRSSWLWIFQIKAESKNTSSRQRE